MGISPTTLLPRDLLLGEIPQNTKRNKKRGCYVSEMGVYYTSFLSLRLGRVSSILYWNPQDENAIQTKPANCILKLRIGFVS
jgi:hypothetical protein